MYYTITIPFQAEFSLWAFMPKDAVFGGGAESRGAFRTQAQAHAWAADKLPCGAQYSVRTRDVLTTQRVAYSDRIGEFGQHVDGWLLSIDGDPACVYPTLDAALQACAEWNADTHLPFPAVAQRGV